MRRAALMALALLLAQGCGPDDAPGPHDHVVRVRQVDLASELHAFLVDDRAGIACPQVLVRTNPDDPANPETSTGGCVAASAVPRLTGSAKRRPFDVTHQVSEILIDDDLGLVCLMDGFEGCVRGALLGRP